MAAPVGSPSGTTLESLVAQGGNIGVDRSPIVGSPSVNAVPLATPLLRSSAFPDQPNNAYGSVGTPLSPGVIGASQQSPTYVRSPQPQPTNSVTVVQERSAVVESPVTSRPVAVTQTTVTTATPVVQRTGPNGLDQLQRLILSQRSEDLSALELRDLLTPPISPEMVLYLESALQRGVLNPSNLLVQAVARATTRETLIPIALALRYGANPNTYVNVPGIGTMHILGYVYVTLGNAGQADSPVINAIIIMLVISGARSIMPIFDTDAGRVRSHINFNETQDRHGPSIMGWLGDQGYVTILPDIQEGFGMVEPGFLNQIGILLDRNDLVTLPLVGVDLQLAFAARSRGVLGRWFDQTVVESSNDDDLRTLLNEQGLSGLAIDFLNGEAFRRLVDLGYIPDYNTVNLLLVRIRQYQAIRDRLSSQQLEEMLLEAVRYGTTLDRDQFAMLASMPFGRTFSDTILQEYNQPYWRKACRQASGVSQPNPSREQLDPVRPLEANTARTSLRPTQVPTRLRRLAVSLGVDPSQNRNEICEALDRLASADPDRLRQAAIRRQQARVSANLANVNEYVGSTSPPMLVCRNQSMLDRQGNPYEYNDLDLAAYRDGSGAVWCFTRDMFESVLETGVNPYSLQPIPESFRIAMQNQLDMSRRLGLLDTRPIRFTEAIDQLRSRDHPDPNSRQGSSDCTNCTDESARIVDTLVQTGTLYGVPAERIRNLTRPQMEQLLQVMGSEPLPLASLTTSHALVTFARQVQDILRRQPDLASMFFSNLNAMA